MVHLLVFSMSNSGAVSVGDSQPDGEGDLPKTNDQQTTSDEHIDPYCELCVERRKEELQPLVCARNATLSLSATGECPLMMAWNAKPQNTSR